MKEITALYENMGISPAVYAYGEKTIAQLKERFDEIAEIFEERLSEYYEINEEPAPLS